MPPLTLQVAPHARQARGQMLQLGQLDLQLAFVALGAQREDIQDQRDPVDHAQVEQPFQVALLGRRQGLVEQHDVGQQGLGHAHALVRLARADEELGVGAVALRRQRADDFGAGALGQHGEFLGMGKEIRVPEVDADDQCAHTCTILKPETKPGRDSGACIPLKREFRPGDENARRRGPSGGQ